MTAREDASQTRHVCIRVPKPGEKERRAEYLKCGDDRGAWVRNCLGADGEYVGRPKLDGGWFKADVVKRGSMFANPYPVPKFTTEESLERYRAYMDKRLSPECTTGALIDLLPDQQKDLARRRFWAGEERPDVGKSVAHLRLGVVGDGFRKSLLNLRGKRLGCFCGEADPCHAKVLAGLVQSLQPAPSRLAGVKRARQSEEAIDLDE